MCIERDHTDFGSVHTISCSLALNALRRQLIVQTEPLSVWSTPPRPPWQVSATPPSGSYKSHLAEQTEPRHPPIRSGLGMIRSMSDAVWCQLHHLPHPGVQQLFPTLDVIHSFGRGIQPQAHLGGSSGGITLLGGAYVPQ